jgi:myo-inositol-1-phosphate synthase
MGKVRVGIVGCGNCACALLQGLQYYGRSNLPTTSEPLLAGLVRPLVGPYTVDDIEVVAAFDITATKVGLDLGAAATAWPNSTYEFADIPELGVVVHRGPTLDGLGLYLRQHLTESDLPVDDVVGVLRAAEVDVLVNYLPVGSEKATRFYAQAALDAGCALVNCMPVFLASDPEWAQEFASAGLPIVGDDIKSQVGATIVHRVLATLFRDRGVHLDRTMQLNIGGNGDFLNMLERERLASKKISKTNAVVSVAGTSFAPGDVHIGPSDYVQWLGDRKWAYIRLEGTAFGGAPLNLECKLEVWDSPNSAGIVIDAVRCAQLARDRGLSGPIDVPSAAFMKSPPNQVDDDDAYDALQEFCKP